jgi:hypothetical protein
MFLLSLSLFVQQLFKEEEGKMALWAKGGTARVLLILVSLVFYGLLLEKLGFILMTFLLMGFLLMAIGKVKKPIVLLLSLLAIPYYIAIQFHLHFDCFVFPIL